MVVEPLAEPTLDHRNHPEPFAMTLRRWPVHGGTEDVDEMAEVLTRLFWRENEADAGRRVIDRDALFHR